MYTDVEMRNMDKVEGDLDLYSAGSPCPAFANQCNHLGMEDPRGALIWHAVDYIDQKRPRSFMLENVPNLLTDERFEDDWVTLCRTLMELADDRGEAAYYVDFNILDTADFGIPQSRRRLYIVGVLKSAQKHPFVWPTPTQMLPLSCVIHGKRGGDVNIAIADLTTTKLRNIIETYNFLLENRIDPESHDYIVNIGGTRPGRMLNRCMCLTANRCGEQAYFSTLRFRVLDQSDMMRLQGVDPVYFAGWEEVISKRQMGRIIGNAMSLNVVEKLVRNIFQSLGIPVSAV